MMSEVLSVFHCCSVLGPFISFIFSSHLFLFYSISFVAPNQPFALSRDKFMASSEMKD